jgi:hypothetical protein
MFHCQSDQRNILFCGRLGNQISVRMRCPRSWRLCGGEGDICAYVRAAEGIQNQLRRVLAAQSRDRLDLVNGKRGTGTINRGGALFPFPFPPRSLSGAGLRAVL